MIKDLKNSYFEVMNEVIEKHLNQFEFERPMYDYKTMKQERRGLASKKRRCFGRGKLLQNRGGSFPHYQNTYVSRG